MTPSCSNNNGNSMTSAERTSPLEAVSEATTAEASAEQNEQQDGNNNEANDSNNNVGNTENSAQNGLQNGQIETTLSVIRPPALPPRPPHLVLPHAGARGAPYSIMTPGGLSGYQDSRLASGVGSRGDGAVTASASSIWKSLRKKYVLLCCLCGGLCLALGILYLVIFFVLGRFTSSLHYFQTLPLYIPAIVLSVTGLLVLCFVRRGNRIGYLIKLCGICCLASAVLCVVVTVTTTVIHMNRLQTLRECVYQGSIQTCTCFAGFFDPTMSHHDATMRFVFAGTPNCEVVHGVLYSCLRALFGLSVIGILVCIFSCMLVYQLLSHERKKKYWEQLELRCRHLYRRQQHQPSSQSSHFGNHPSSILLTPGSAQCGYCVEDPRYYNTNPEVYPQGLYSEYWNQAQRSNGNIYSPNPEENVTQNEAETQDTRLSRSLSRSFRTWFPWLSSRLSSPGSGSEVIMRPRNPNVNPLWRHSNPDSHYGFRQQPLPNSAGGYRGRYHLPSSGTTPADLSHYSAIPSDHLPRYLWGPPPPYSQPPSIENIREATEVSSTTPNNINSSITPTSTTSTMTQAVSNSARTTRSGLLNYDETVKSAMHLYERNIVNSNSLPSRRLSRKQKNQLKSFMTQSVANLQRSLKEEEEAALFSEVRQKLNALNGMYRYQHSKAAQELAEIRRALNSLQTSGPTGLKYKNLPLPPIPNMIYQPPSVISSSNSTENKYETIGKSLQPYKIEESSSASSSCAQDYGFSSASPMSVAGPNTESPASVAGPNAESPSEEAKISSHYAQISPLRGQGLPHPAVMGLNNSGHNSVTASPVKSYFQELQRQDAAKSLPNINSSLTSPKTTQPPPPRRPTTNNLQSPLLLQPQNLPQLNQPNRSYSASSEMLLSNAQYKLNSTRALVGSPIQYRSQQRPRSSSMLQEAPPIGRLYHHPYQQLPGASLSLQTGLNLNNKGSNACVYLRPEQNIPEVFANPGTVFKPIDEVDNASDVNDNENVINQTGAISRDDIVVTMRSVNV